MHKVSAITVALVLMLGLAAAAVAAATPGMSLFGDLKYGPDFQHFDYVNPDAPKGGELRLSGIQTYDTLNPYTLKGVTAEAAAHPLPALTLTRGARHLAFLPGGRALVFLRGEIQHKNLWLVDLETGAERQLTNLPADFEIGDFDISPDGREVVLERVQERSDVVLLDLMPS